MRDVELHGVRAQTASGAPTLVLRDVDDLRVMHSPPLRDAYVKHADRQTY